VVREPVADAADRLLGIGGVDFDVLVTHIGKNGVVAVSLRL
jgi:hypothetical protein